MARKNPFNRRNRAARRGDHCVVALRYASVLIVILGCLAGCAGDPSVQPAPEARRQQIATLEASIARDRSSLEDLVSEPRNDEAMTLHEDANLREIAERIMAETRLLEQLKLLESQSSHSAPPR